MPTQLIDSHAHLDMAQFDEDRSEAISRAVQAGVKFIVSVGTDIPSSHRAVELAKEYPELVAAVGIHPQETKDITPEDIANLAGLAKLPGIAAIGEIGLDFYRDYSPHDKQIEILKQQLELASSLKLPVIIHSRQAETAIVPVLREWLINNPTAQPGVIHCFMNDLPLAKTYLEMGFSISLGAYMCYSSSKALREVVKELPLEKILVETDSPFLPPQALRGKRNEPACVAKTAEELARIKGVSFEEIAAKTTENAARLFRLG
jgi:TatD DNase family protein